MIIEKLKEFLRKEIKKNQNYDDYGSMGEVDAYERCLDLIEELEKDQTISKTKSVEE